MGPPIKSINSDGFTVVPAVISAAECERLGHLLDAREISRVGTRNLLTERWCAELAMALQNHQILWSALPRDAVPIQCTYFDKSSDKNWLVALHQDLSIPVSRRVDSPECSGWSEKEGVVYVQPPAAVLESLLAIRVHIDPCPPESGALRVVPGSHSHGRVDAATASAMRSAIGERVVPVGEGGALLMRPLLLHASSKATVPAQRRVLHFSFGPRVLPSGLSWAQVA